MNINSYSLVSFVFCSIVFPSLSTPLKVQISFTFWFFEVLNPDSSSFNSIFTFGIFSSVKSSLFTNDVFFLESLCKIIIAGVSSSESVAKHFFKLLA